MTHQQIVDLCNYLGVPVASDEESLRQLKKMLLLELKSSTEGVLTIGGKTYDKNEINRLFEPSADYMHWNSASILDAFPVLKQLLDFSLIRVPKKLPDTLWQHPDIHEFRTREAEPRFEAFKREVLLTLRSHDLKRVSGLLMLLDLFSDDQHYKITTDLKITLRDKFQKILTSLEEGRSRNKLPEEAYFRDIFYYDVVTQIASDDEEFLVEQLMVAERLMRSFRKKEISLSMYRYQYKLPLPQEIKWQIKRNIDALSGVEHSSDSSNYRWIGTAVVVLLIVLRACLRFGSDSHSSSQDMDMILLRQQLQRQYESRQMENASDSLKMDYVDSTGMGIIQMDTLR